MERSNKAKREFESELAKRLALGFESESWGEGSTLSFDEVGGGYRSPPQKPACSLPWAS